MKLLVKISLLYILFFLPNNNYAQPTNVNLQLKWWHQFQFAGYYAAVNKGFYAEQGLNVRIISGDKDHPPLQQVLLNKADFGVTGSDLIVNYANGDPVKVIGAIFQHSPYVFISLKNRKINAATDLVGKTIMGSKDQGWIQLQAILIKEGISNSKINLIEHTWNNDDLIAGKTDVITGYISVEPFQIIQKGHEINYIEPVNYGIDFYGDVLFCTKQMAEKNPELVKKFRQASFKGWEYAMEHIEEMVNYILTLPGVKERGTTKEILTFEANAMKKLIMPDLVEVGHMNEGRWQHILDIHKNFGLVPKNAMVNDFVFNPERGKNNVLLRWIYYVIAPVLLILFIGILYTASLKRAVKRRTVQLEKEIVIRKTTEENLKISEERLELAATAAGLGNWDWNLTTHEIYYSDILKSMLGYEPHEIENSITSFMHLLHPDHNEEINTKLHDHIFNKNDRYEAIVRLKMKNGNWKWVLIISKALSRNKEGVALRLTGIHLDIDTLKKKEIELQELTDELMHSNKGLQQFAYITSHNLRAPVANLMSLLMLFETEQLSENNITYLDKIQFCVDKLNQTMNDLNEILSSSATKGDYFENIDIETAVNNTLASISEEVNNTKTKIETNYAVKTVFCSKKVIDSILINLLTNAIKYKRLNTNPVIKIETYLQNEFTVLKISDNGIGIDLERFKNKIFGLYQRFDTNFPGKGIGLFIIKNQIEAIQGTIDVHSKINEGTSFVIQLKNS